MEKEMDEGRKRILGVIAAIFACRKLALLLLLPHIPKQLDRIRPMPGVVIIRVGVDPEIPRDELPENNPTQIV